MTIEAGTAADLAGNTAPEYTTSVPLQVNAPGLPVRPYWLLVLLPLAAVVVLRSAVPAVQKPRDLFQVS